MYLRFKSSLIGFNPSLLFPGNLQNYYNPFNPETWIPDQLAVDTEVSLIFTTVEDKQISAQELGDSRKLVTLIAGRRLSIGTEGINWVSRLLVESTSTG